MRLLTTTLVAAVATLSASQAFAFATDMCFGQRISWATDNPTLRASTTSFPTGYWRDGLQKATDRINQNPTPFWFTLGTDSDGLALDNDQNEVWGTTDNGLLNGAPARAFTWWNCFQLSGTVYQNIKEADVIFDYRSPWQWTADEVKTSVTRYTGTLRQLQGTAIHEFGHAMGLNHVNTEYNVMGADFEHMWANGSTVRGYLGEDAADGAVALYGLWSANWQDVAVSHWRYSNASGEYSRHVKTAVYNTSDVQLPTVMVNGEVGYKVKRGQFVRVDFTYENNGKNTQAVNTGWYISTNDLISTSDRLVATNTGMSLGRGDVMTYRRQFRIPFNLTVNRNYWIGTIVDKDNTVTDAVRSNNATYIPIRVVP